MSQKLSNSTLMKILILKLLTIMVQNWLLKTKQQPIGLKHNSKMEVWKQKIHQRNRK